MKNFNEEYEGFDERPDIITKDEIGVGAGISEEDCI